MAGGSHGKRRCGRRQRNGRSHLLADGRLRPGRAQAFASWQGVSEAGLTSPSRGQYSAVPHPARGSHTGIVPDVGVLDRLRGVTRPEEGMAELQHALAPEHRIRVPLYSNERLVGDTFAQRMPNVVEMLTGGELTLELGGGYMSFVSAKASKKRTSSQTIAITPMIQVLMLEDGAAQDGSLVNLADRPARASDGLLSFVGPGRIVAPGIPVTAVTEAGLTPELARRLQAKRVEQEQWMDLHDGPRGTFVWLAAGAGPNASIASIRHADVGALGSYAPLPPFGILGLFEGTIEALTMVAPLMVWHHAGGAP
jgi:hypothetical protein